MMHGRNPLHPRATVSVSLILKENGPANLSVSVYDLNLLRPDNQARYIVSENLKTSTLMAESERIHAPEKSLRVHGRLTDPDTKEPLNSNVLSVFDPSEMIFTRLKSKDGFFTFELPIFEGRRKFQIINMNPFQPKVPEVEIIRHGSMISTMRSPRDLPEKSDEINKYLYYSRIRNKIGEMFQDDILDSLKLMPASRPAYEPDRSYDMSEYRLIKNVEEFINEGITNSTTFRKDGQKKVKLFNTETKKFFMTEPWMMVDGHFIFNDSLAYNIPFSNVSRIDVFTTNTSLLKYFDPIMIQGGVIAIYTNNNYLEDYTELLPNMITVNGVFNDPVIYSLDSRMYKYGQGPDLDPMIYWNPSVLTDDEGKARVDLRMNDIIGNCLIVVEGTDRHGNYILGELTYRAYP